MRFTARFTARTGAPVARWGLVLALLFSTLPATAAETILSLGVLRDGKLDAKVSRTVQQRLTRAGETAPPTAHLELADRQCALPACLDTLAGREKAQLILAARVQQSSGFSYIAAFLYDVANQRQMDVSAVCDKCLPEAQALRVGDLFERLLHDYRDRQSAEALAPRRPNKTAPGPAPTSPLAANNQAPAQTQAPSATDATAASQAQQTAAATPQQYEPAERIPPINTKEDSPRRYRKRSADSSSALSPRRKIVAGVLGGLGVAALVTAIALHATDGNTTSLDCDQGSALAKVCVLDNKVGYSLGYALTGALAVGVGVTLFWPESGKSNRTEVK